MQYLFALTCVCNAASCVQLNWVASYCTHSLIHPLTYLPTYPLTHPPMHALARSLARSLTHSLTQQLTHSAIQQMQFAMVSSCSVHLPVTYNKSTSQHLTPIACV